MTDFFNSFVYSLTSFRLFLGIIICLCLQSFSGQPLPILESNGLIETYEVYWTLPDKSTKNESVPASQNSTKIKLWKNDYIFTVKAKNKAGVSPPSSINSAELPVGK